MTAELEARALAARLEDQAKRQGAAAALNDVADTIERACGFGDALDAKGFARLLRKEARSYLDGTAKTPW